MGGGGEKGKVNMHGKHSLQIKATNLLFLYASVFFVP